MLRSPSAAVPIAPAPGARTLYLATGGKKRVTCNDESLVVTNDRKQTYRYPLLRVARVVSSTAVDWSGEAMALCLRRGVGIAWIDGRGQPLGISYPQARENTSFATALELMVELPEGELRYRHWQRARRMEVLVRWGRIQHTLSPKQWEAAKCEWVYAGKYMTHLPVLLRAHCLAYVGAQLAHHNLPPVLWNAQAQRIDLDEDLCELLWAEMNLGAGSLADTANEDQCATALFERWNARNACAFVLHIHSLQRLAMKALTS